MISNLSRGENERFTMENEGNIISIELLISSLAHLRHRLGDRRHLCWIYLGFGIGRILFAPSFSAAGC